MQRQHSTPTAETCSKVTMSELGQLPSPRTVSRISALGGGKRLKCFMHCRSNGGFTRNETGKPPHIFLIFTPWRGAISNHERDQE
jgi:hypothetical protein